MKSKKLSRREAALLREYRKKVVSGYEQFWRVRVKLSGRIVADCSLAMLRACNEPNEPFFIDLDPIIPMFSKTL